MGRNVIEFKQVGKKFKKGRKLLLKEALLDFVKPSSSEYFWALKDLNLEIKEGEALGIIGSNGSGKSTILKLVAGVMIPTEGKTIVNGKVSPLIELGAGFHPELSGKENIFLNGAILGLSTKDIENRYKEILEFSEMKDFIDTPIKHYSSGMQMRLAFSIAVNVDPKILIVDEILAVGDISFQDKSLKKMYEFKKEGVTVIFVSHDLQSVENFCSRVIILEDGSIVDDGKPSKIVDNYKRQFNKIA